MSDTFEQLRATFLAWVDLSVAERTQRLAVLQETNPGLAAELERLFAADENGPDLVDVGGQTPKRLGRFRVLRELGRGGMGVVYEAEQDLPRRRVALKMALTATPVFDELFRREVQAMVEVIHPGIPQVYEVFQADGHTVAAMELVEGEPLVGVLGRYPGIEERVRLLLRVTEAVAFAHARGVVHRDLKPGNVLVTPTGQPKVIDFGIATLGDTHGPAGSGSLTWMAPEQLAGDAVDARADVYALGAVAWRVLVGSELVDVARVIAVRAGRGSSPSLSPGGDERAAVLAAKLAAAPAAPELPLDLHAVLAKALSVSPADRYSDAGAFADDLRAYLDGRTVGALTDRRDIVRAWVGRRRRSIGRALLAAGVVGVIGAGAVVAAVMWPRILREEAAETALGSLRAAHDRGDTAGFEEAFLAFVRAPDTLGTDALSNAWSWHATLEGSDPVADRVGAYATAVGAERRAASTVELAAALLAAEAWDPFVRLMAEVPASTRTDLHAHVERLSWRFGAGEAAAGLDRALGGLLTVNVPRGLGVVLPDHSLVYAEGAALVRQHVRGEVLARAELPEAATMLTYAHGALWVRSGRALLRVVPDTLSASVAVVSPFDFGRFAIADTDGDGEIEVYLHGPYPLRRLYRVDDGVPVPADASFDAAQLDVNALVVADLEGDGADELVISSAGWSSRDLRVWDAGHTTARVRLFGGVAGVGRGLSGTWIAAMVGELSDRAPLDLTLFDRHLNVVQHQRLPSRMEQLWVTDLDGDGADDVLLNRSADRVTATYIALGGGGGLVPAVPIPGLSVVDARDGVVWWTDGGRGWISGLDGRSALPARVVSSVEPARAVPDVGPMPLRAAWERLEVLAALGLPTEAGAALTAVGRAAAPDVSTAALARALDLLGPEEAVEVAGLLADGRALDPVVAGRVADVLGQAHAFDNLPPVGRWAEVAVALATETTFAFEGPIDPRITVDRPESIRRLPLAPGLALRATADRGVLFTLPMVLDRRAAEVVVELALESVDWASGIELALDTGGDDATLVLARGGGGPPARHRLSAFCGDQLVVNIPWLERPPSLRIHLSRLPDAVGCVVEGYGRARASGSPGQAPNARLQLRTHRHKGWENGGVIGTVRTIQVRGATLPPASELGGDGRRFASGDPGALAQAVASGPSLLSALAAAELGEDVVPHLRALADRDLRFLLRTNPQRWLTPVRAAVPERFVALVTEAWEQAIGYDEAEAVGASATLSGLALGSQEGRTLALVRARALLGAEGGRAEAESVLARLREGPDSADAWALTARLRLRAGDRAGAGAAIAAWVHASGGRGVTEDTVFDDAELAAVVPEGIAPAAVYRR